MDKKQKRAAALKRQQELVNDAKAASKEITAEETAEFNTLQGQIDQLNREIADEERQQGGNPPAPPTPSAGAATTPPDQQRDPVGGMLQQTAVCGIGCGILQDQRGEEPPQAVDQIGGPADFPFPIGPAVGQGQAAGRFCHI